MREDEAESLFKEGVIAYREGKTLHALVCFEKALLLNDNPAYYSYFGYCMARERGQINRGFSLCEDALRKEPANPVHYMNLAKIYDLTENRDTAIKLLRDGLKHGENVEIMDLLNSFGIRKEPVFPSLKRIHPVNKYLGIILKKIGLR